MGIVLLVELLPVLHQTFCIVEIIISGNCKLVDCVGSAGVLDIGDGDLDLIFGR